ncbi:MAG TPA: shikimate kinase [Candidatus Omnitrophota bacterium]|nr:shikimate kinase [Candidatus Omnitrophota bacterium]
MKNIYLIGMMGSGKTSTARELSALLSMPLIDLDAELEMKSGKKIAEIFREKGEDWFRDTETSILTRYPADTSAVFATGGGVVIREENREWMRACGTVVYLETDLEDLWKRVSKETGRPLLEDFDPKQKLMSILNTRQPLYEDCANVRVVTNGKTPREVAVEIEKKLK